MDYKVVDVFTSKMTRGNPVAVVLDAQRLTSDEMQSIARWTNLSETTFVLAPTAEADYRVRIFTPTGELPFAGHPSLGTAHALIESGVIARKPVVVQQCLRGLIEIRTENGLQFGIDNVTSEAFSKADVEAALGLPIRGEPQVVNTGPLWVVAELDGTAKQLLEYEPRQKLILELSERARVTGICLFAAREEGVELRTFAPVVNVAEDPVCGSGNAAVAFYRQSVGSACGHYEAFQGSAIHRDGRISVNFSDNKIWIGGNCVTGVLGRLTL